MKKWNCLTVILWGISVIFPALVFGQDPVTISFSKRYASARSDTARVTLLIQEASAFVGKDVRKSLEYSLKAVYLAEKADAPHHLKLAVQAAFNSSFYSGLFGEAARFAGRYLELVEPNGDLLELGVAFNNLGAVKLAQDMTRYDPAVEAWFLKSLDAYQGYIRKTRDASLNDKLLSIYSNLAILNDLKKDYPAAKKYIEQGLELAKGQGIQRTQYLRLLAVKGDLLLKQNQYAAARACFEEGLQGSIDAKDQVIEAAFRYYLGTLYENQGNTSLALEYYQQFFEMSSAQTNHATIYEAAKKLSALYQKTGDSGKALYYLQIAREHQEKMELLKANEAVMRAEMISKINTLEKEMEDKAALRSRKQWMLVGGGLSLCFFIAGILYFNARRKYMLAELASMEKELIARKLELEKILLESEIATKDKEITTETLYKIQRNEAIEEIVQKLKALNKHNIQSEHREVIGKVVKDLQKSMESNTWEEFELRFQQVNADFYQKLREINPALTPNERRLCAFLSLNMSSKEISAITGQSLESLKKARLRLRKKLNLTNSDVDLTDFLSAL